MMKKEQHMSGYIVPTCKLVQVSNTRSLLSGSGDVEDIDDGEDYGQGMD